MPLMGNQHVIEIVSKFVDGTSKPIEVMSRSVKSLNGRFEQVTTTTSRLNEKTGAYSNTIDRVQTRQKRFQMQWLSLLFFGFAIQRMFSGLIKTSLDWVGVTEIMTATLGVFFLPIALQLLEILLPIFDWFMNLSDSTKKFVGWIVVAGVAIGGFLSVLGQIALGFGGLSWFASGATAGSKFLSGISSKVNAASLANLFKYGAAAITIGMAIKDLTEGQLTAAVGAATLGVGIMTGNPWLIGIGVVLKLIGDEEFLTDILALGYKLLDWAFRIGEEMWSAILAGLNPFQEYEMSADIQKSFINALGRTDFKSETLKGFNVPTAEGPGRPFLTPEEASSYLGSTGYGGNVSFSNTYNVSVADKREFEIMLRDNNETLKREVSRSVGNT